MDIADFCRLADQGDLDGVRGALRTHPDLGSPVSLIMALHEACYWGHRDVAAFLLDRGADPLVPNLVGRGAMHIAAQKANIPLVTLFLDRGVPINSRDSSGQTLLHMAARQNLWDLAGLLVRRGADINGRDDAGHTALWIARDQGYSRVIAILEKAGGSLAGAVPPPPPERELYRCECPEFKNLFGVWHFSVECVITSRQVAVRSYTPHSTHFQSDLAGLTASSHKALMSRKYSVHLQSKSTAARTLNNVELFFDSRVKQEELLSNLRRARAGEERVSGEP